MKTQIIKIIAALTLLAALILIGHGVYIQAKALLAQYYIEDAWHTTLETSEPQKPWSWADTEVVMKMHVPSLGKEIYILEGDTGSSLAFAPGHSSASFLPKDNGTVMVSAHRDTHFSFLKQLKQGDEVILQDKNKQLYYYTMTQAKVIDTKKDTIPIYSGIDELVLVTCWPFDAVKAGGSQRYIAKFEL